MLGVCSPPTHPPFFLAQCSADRHWRGWVGCRHLPGMSTASLMLTARKGSPRGGLPWPPSACRSLTLMKPTPGIPPLLAVSTSCCSLPGPGRPPHLAASLLPSFWLFLHWPLGWVGHGLAHSGQWVLSRSPIGWVPVFCLLQWTGSSTPNPVDVTSGARSGDLVRCCSVIPSEPGLYFPTDLPSLW